MFNNKIVNIGFKNIISYGRKNIENDKSAKKSSQSLDGRIEASTLQAMLNIKYCFKLGYRRREKKKLD